MKAFSYDSQLNINVGISSGLMNITTAIKASPIATAIETNSSTCTKTVHIRYEPDCKRIIYEIDKMSICSNMSVHKNLSVAHIYLDKLHIHTHTHR